jgi:hypothetical protein
VWRVKEKVNNDMKKIIAMLFLLTTIVIAPAFASDWYASPTGGSSGNGSLSQRKRRKECSRSARYNNSRLVRRIHG